MKISPLDVKKKKVIQKIRTLLNDSPDLHPLAHKVLLGATYTVLSKLYQDILEADGPAQKLTKGQRIEKIAEAISKAKRFTDKRTTIDTSLNLEEKDKKARQKSKNRGKDRDRNPNQELEDISIHIL